MKHYSFYWDEPRDDQYAEWGTITYYFEVGETGYVEKQLEVYENGSKLSYDRHHPVDHYSTLPPHPFELEGCKEVDSALFYHLWTTATPFNRQV